MHIFRQIYIRTRFYLNVLVAGALPPAACRFTPTCSVYCAEAVHKYGIFIGSGKCFWRIVRCNPLVKGGIDEP